MTYRKCTFHTVLLPFHPSQQLAHPPFTYLHSLCRFSLGDLFTLGLVQPLQPVPFLLIERHWFL
jgi:hypothetical protein